MLNAMGAMVLLTFIAGFIMVKSRMNSVKSGEVKAKYFKLMAGQDLPDFVARAGRHYNNHFELPILFYVAGVLYISLGIESTLGLVLAWAFVISRYVHTYIHLTHNHILHRMKTFAFGFVCVFGLWVNLLLSQ